LIIYKEEIKAMPGSSKSLQFFPLLSSFFPRTWGSSKNNNKTIILEKLCCCFRRKDNNYSQIKNVPNSAEQQYIEGCHLTLPFLDPARKAF